MTTVVPVTRIPNFGFVNKDGTVSCLLYAENGAVEVILPATLARDLGAGLSHAAKRSAKGERDEK